MANKPNVVSVTPPVVAVPATPVAAPSVEEIARAKAVLAAARASRPASARYGGNVSLVNPAPAGADRLPRQARMVLEILAGLKGACSMVALCNALTPVLASAGYRQDGLRIFTFYRKRLLDEKRITCS